VVGLTEAFKPFPDRRGLYVPSAGRTAGAGAIPLKVVASAAR
jgi:chemotaxis protein methyltransferase CheR